LEPLLHEALDSLNARERNALMLRFFEARSLRETGEALGISEEAARKRVDRALEKMRTYFSKHGFLISGVLLAGLLKDNSVQAAPAHFVAATVKLSSVATLQSLTVEVAGAKVYALWQGTMHAMLVHKGIVTAGLLSRGRCSPCPHQSGR
jgi:hypothetical protein